MRVRAIEPKADERGLEELVATPPRPGPSDRGDPQATASDGGPPPEAEVRLVTRARPVTAADLGPNGGDVMDFLERAARITPAERRSLEKTAAWRWWMMTPLPGATMPGARARALVVGRADGRSDAIAALQVVVAALVRSVVGAKAGRSRLPWREVMRD